MVPADMSRREHSRETLLRDIQDEGYRILGRGGPSAVTMSGVAHAVGLTGTALYRYFPSQEALVRSLILASFVDSAGVAANSRSKTTAKTGLRRVHHLLRSQRTWALEHPVQYQVVTGSLASIYGIDIDERVAPEDRPLSVLRDLVHAAMLEHRVGVSRSVADAALALRAYSRLHGVISLQITGGLSPDVADDLFEAELTWLESEIVRP